MEFLETLTIKQAKQQGYKYCGYANKEWQPLTLIDELKDIDFSEDTFVLAGKESLNYSVNQEFISDLISDVVSQNESDESGRDDDEVYNALKELDYKKTVDLINECLNKFGYRTFTHIKLIP